MTKEEVLQKVNDYCNEKSYTTETLTDDFKDKFSDFFAKKYSEETTFESEEVLNDLQFNLNTAFSATSKGITAKVKTFETKESEYKRQIAELNKRLGKDDNQEPTPIVPAIPQDLKDKLDRLEQFEQKQRLAEKFKEVMAIAKRNVRNDLHKSLDSYASDFVVNLDETSEEQAKKLTARFQDIFRESIGDIKPLAPQVTRKRDEEFLNSIPKVKI